MSGPFPKDLSVRTKVNKTADDPRQYQVSAEKNFFSETHRGRGPGGRAGSDVSKSR